MRKVVVFPAPFGPRRPKISPRRTSKLTRSTAVNAPKRRTSSRTVTTGSASDRAGGRSASAIRPGSLETDRARTTMKPSSKRGAAAESAPGSRRGARGALSRALTIRTWPASGTASTTSGKSSNRAWNPCAESPSGGLTRKTRPRASSLTVDGGPSARTFPLWRTATRAHRSASSRYEVATSTVRPSPRSCPMIAQSSRRERGSTPTVGSSRRRSSGTRTSVHARPSFCFMPPERRPARRPSNRPSAVISMSRTKRARRASRVTP